MVHYRWLGKESILFGDPKLSKKLDVIFEHEKRERKLNRDQEQQREKAKSTFIQPHFIRSPREITVSRRRLKLE